MPDVISTLSAITLNVSGLNTQIRGKNWQYGCKTMNQHYTACNREIFVFKDANRLRGKGAKRHTKRTVAEGQREFVYYLIISK